MAAAARRCLLPPKDSERPPILERGWVRSVTAFFTTVRISQAPYHITVTARELDPASDDEFTEGSADVTVDLSTLQATASVTISQKPGDKDDTDVGDEPNDPDDPDEEASYTISFLAEVEPAVSVITAHVKNNNILVQLSPEGASATLTLTLKGLNGAEKEIYSEQASGGTVQQTF